MERVSDAVTPQPVCAVVGAVDVPLAELAATDRLVLVCVDVRDPGNLGAVLRVGDALGCGGVVCAGTTVDPYNPKVVRASAGSVFHARFAVTPSVTGALSSLSGAGFRVLSTAARGGDPYDETDLDGRVAVLLGNEAAGLPTEVAGSSDGVVTVPMEGGAESLNVAATAAVIAARAASQRRHRI